MQTAKSRVRGIVARGIQRTAQLDFQIVEGLLHDGEHDAGLIGEVPVDRGGRDTDPTCHGAQGHGRLAAGVVEQCDGPLPATGSEVDSRAAYLSFGLAAELNMPDLQTMLWPTWSGFLVGVLYLGEGASRRNLLHYGLGTWLALTSAAALFLGIPRLFSVLMIAGGGFAVAAVLESRRLAGTAGRLSG